jgi:hypothetical protein
LTVAIPVRTLRVPACLRFLPPLASFLEVSVLEMGNSMLLLWFGCIQARREATIVVVDLS